jgi:hypothetical protein
VVDGVAPGAAATLPAKIEIHEDVDVGQLLNQVEVIQEAMREAMTRGVHYGEIVDEDGVIRTPPTLLKLGAQKLCKLFHLRPRYEEVGSVHRPDLVGYRTRCVLVHFPTGLEVGEGLGSCNSREKKYRRQDPWDIDNTILKMAAKRALVEGVLVSTAAGDIFTDKARKTRGELSRILNGRAAEWDVRKPRADGITWMDWTRAAAKERWGYDSRGDCTDEELEELIAAMDAALYEMEGGIIEPDEDNNPFQPPAGVQETIR